MCETYRCPTVVYIILPLISILECSYLGFYLHQLDFIKIKMFDNFKKVFRDEEHLKQFSLKPLGRYSQINMKNLESEKKNPLKLKS